GGERVGDLLWNQAAFVGRHRGIHRFVQRKRLQGPQIAGGFDQDLAARIDEQLAQHVERLLGARHDDDFVDRDIGTALLEVVGDPLAQRGVDVGRDVWKGRYTVVLMYENYGA